MNAFTISLVLLACLCVAVSAKPVTSVECDDANNDGRTVDAKTDNEAPDGYGAGMPMGEDGLEIKIITPEEKSNSSSNQSGEARDGIVTTDQSLPTRIEKRAALEEPVINTILDPNNSNVNGPNESGYNEPVRSTGDEIEEPVILKGVPDDSVIYNSALPDGSVIDNMPIGPHGPVMGKPAVSDGSLIGKPVGPDSPAIVKPVGSDGSVIGKPVGSDGSVIDKPVGSDGSVIDKPVGSDGSVIDKPVGSDGSVIDKPVGSDGSVIDKPVGSDGSVIDKPVGSDGSVIDKPVGQGDLKAKNADGSCTVEGVTYSNGQTFNSRCGECTCTNSDYWCVDACELFDLPDPSCRWVHRDGHCCEVPECPPGVEINYPDWWKLT